MSKSFEDIFPRVQAAAKDGLDHRPENDGSRSEPKEISPAQKAPSDVLETHELESLPIVKRPREEPTAFDQGELLGPYRIKSLIGRGPHGIVFEAEDAVQFTPVAIKIISREVAAAGPKWIKRFLDSAKRSIQMSHRVILDVLALGEEGSTAYFVMPILRHGSIQNRLQTEGPFSSPLGTRIALKIMDALVYLHSQGITHGNIKPTNVFVDSNEQVKLADLSVPLGESLQGSRVLDQLKRRVEIDLRLWAALYHRLLTGRAPTSQGDVDASLPEPLARIIRGIFDRRPEYSDAPLIRQALTKASSELAKTRLQTVRAARPENVVAPMPMIGELEPGQILGKCLILEPLGRGKMGSVYKARHTTLNIPVAVKVLHSHQDPGDLQRFQNEARLLAQLNHPNLIRVWDFEDDPRYPYLVLEYVEGPTLADEIRVMGRLPASRAVSIIGQIADGLAAAHRVGIVHRDVKPSNILLTPEGRAKLVDMGLALVVEPEHSMSRGVLAGTLAYMAPEQSLGQPVDHRADMYSLGATFYHAVTGEMPFTGATPADVLRQHVSGRLTPACEKVPSLPKPVCDVIERMMAKSPADRYQSADELFGDLLDLDRFLNPTLAGRIPSWRMVPGL
jgi:serine/threonine protein kinase